MFIQKNNKLKLKSEILLLTGILTWLTLLHIPNQAEKLISHNTLYVSGNKSIDKCGFRVNTENPTANEEFLEWQRKQSYGYSTEISLTEAVKSFNEELLCYPHRANLAPLTEDEIVASILAGTDYGKKENWLNQKKELLEIANKRKMPKGSLLVQIDGALTIDNPLDLEKTRISEARGQRIYIYLGLDKTPDIGGSQMKSDQFFLVRKTFYSQR